MSALIPDSDQSINVNYRHGNNGRDSYRAGYVGQIYNISPNNNLSYKGKLFVGAKKLDVLSSYDEKLSIPRFTDAIDWDIYFLTKPVSYAINWFYGCDNWISNNCFYNFNEINSISSCPGLI